MPQGAPQAHLEGWSRGLPASARTETSFEAATQAPQDEVERKGDSVEAQRALGGASAKTRLLPSFALALAQTFPYMAINDIS
jgi:hypothetical protein